MAGATTTYGPESVSNVTQHPAFGGGAGGNIAALLPFMLGMALRRQQPMGGVMPTRGGFGRSSAPRTSSAPPSFGGVTPEDMRRARAQELALAEIEQRFKPPPMRMTTFASGANNFYTPDVNAMSAIQRQMFLPQGATMASFEPEAQTTREPVYEDTGQYDVIPNPQQGGKPIILPRRGPEIGGRLVRR